MTVEDVIKAFKSKDSEKRIPVLRMEIDYELAELYEAIQEKNTHRIDQCKARLTELRREMLLLEAI
ncbi:hypothetical protein [Numidum massiliense]|uniref:hypothetical protein n=1 Tax=Numidum massiliense TaxID=1522315 RepID=UPI001E2FAD57|nr:hypothetical protein [Numidum massiliense]